MRPCKISPSENGWTTLVAELAPSRACMALTAGFPGIERVKLKRILMILIPGDGGSALEPALRLVRVLEPYYLFLDSGAEVVLASPEGGFPWMPREEIGDGPSRAIADRYRTDRTARDAFADTLGLDQVYAEDFAGAFCVGEVASIWRSTCEDLASSIIAAMLEAGKPVALIPDATDLAPGGAGEGLLILGHAGESPGLAAEALLGAMLRRQ